MIFAFRVGVHVVRDAVLDDQPAGELGAPLGRLRTVADEPLEELAPVRTDVSGNVEELVVAPAAVGSVEA